METENTNTETVRLTRLKVESILCSHFEKTGKTVKNLNITCVEPYDAHEDPIHIEVELAPFTEEMRKERAKMVGEASRTS